MPIERVFWSVTPDQSKSPYIREIADAIEAQGCRVERLSLRELAKLDKQVVHIQWPEHVSRGPSVASTAAKHARALALLAVFRIRKHAVVLTAHNRAPHGDSDAFDAWFRRSIEQSAKALVLLVAEHQAELENDNAIGPNAIVQTITHPMAGPDESLQLLPESQRTQLVVLGQIHPYHRIEEFVDALAAQGSTRPVCVVGSVGDTELVESLEAKARNLPWLSIQPGFADDAALNQILTSSAAVVSLQRTAFNSGGPYFALPRNLPIILSDGAQADQLKAVTSNDWVFAVPEDVHSLSVAELDAWLDRERSAPVLDYFAVEGVAAAHIELYELLKF